MSQALRPMPIRRMLEHITRELEMSSTVFGVTPNHRGDRQRLELPFGAVEFPLGVAPGPHGMMAQNLATAYVAGARFLGLAPVSPRSFPGGRAPYLRVADQCRRRPRGQSLDLDEALGEAVKGSFVARLLGRELGLGEPDGMVFAMSVSGNRDDLAGPEMTAYFDAMADASATGLWAECQGAALAAVRRFNNLDKDYIQALSPRISNLVIVRWDPAGDPAELEGAARYLLEERKLHTYVELEPAVLGLDRVRGALERLNAGGEDLPLGEKGFGPGLETVAPALERLAARAEELGLAFGVSLSGCLPLAGGDTLSGPALAPLTLTLAAAVAERCPGLPMMYAGGADAFNARRIYALGFSPIAACTTLLKPGGYLRLRQMARAMASAAPGTPGQVDAAGALALAQELGADPRWRFTPREPGRRRIPGKAPLLDCFTAPCAAGCPFGADITGYLRLMSDGRYRDALRVILDRNPLPHITGAICPQPCGHNCTRIFYDEPIRIREAEALCAGTAWKDLLARLEPAEPLVGQRVAVVGGGPAGMSAAFLLARRGVPVTLFEKEEELGGAVRRYIPHIRVKDADIDADAQLLEAMGVDVRLGAAAPAAPKLLKSGYSHVLVAIGAGVSALLPLEGKQPLDVLTFLEAQKKDPTAYVGHKNIVVVGAGDAAVDAARLAARFPGVERLTVVSPGKGKKLPPRVRELPGAVGELITILTETIPVAWDGVELRLTDVSACREVRLKADLVIAAVGAAVDGGQLTFHGATLDAAGKPAVSESLETGHRNIYVLGDARRGPGTVAEAIADAHRAVDAILGRAAPYPHTAGRRGGAMGKKGKLAMAGEADQECERCLECATVCECCVDVCPNRANVPITVLTRGRPQIVHLDALCDKCGVCEGFCPYESAPHRDKFTLFETLEDFEGSDNAGFVVLDFLSRKVRLRLEGRVRDASLRHVDMSIPGDIQELMETIFTDYPYLLDEGRRRDEVQLSLWS